MPFYQVLARKAVRWNTRGNIGLVVGATYPAELADVRTIAPNLPILLPGVGAQQGDVNVALEAGLDARGGGLIVSASRAILYAYREGDGEPSRDYSQAARAAAQSVRDAINSARSVKTTRAGL
jgi:orotidine-5'-phosphate decarboxylase